MLRKALKYITGKTWQPFVASYLSQPRIYRYKGIRLTIPPQVFHPAFFFSTRYLVKYLSKLDLNNKTFLELGAGSGLISFFAEKKGATVTATDINRTAIEYLEKNKKENNSRINIIHSDLFNNIPQQQFDIIVINPPYYKKQPQTELEHAWFCGENGEYFDRLFRDIRPYIHKDTTAYIILSDDGDIPMVKVIATKHHCTLSLTDKKNMLLETNFIYRILSKT